MTPREPRRIGWIAVKTTLMDVGLAPGVLKYDEIPAASCSHDRAHAGVAGVVGNFQFDTPKTVLGDATLHLALDRACAEGGIEATEPDKIIGVPTL